MKTPNLSLTLSLLLIIFSVNLAMAASNPSVSFIAAEGFSNLSTALSSPGTVDKVLTISSVMSINNKTVTEKRLVKIIAGGRIDVAFGKILTFANDSSFESGNNMVFGGAGKVVGLKNASPDMFAVNKIPGVTDMTAAVQAALSSGADVTGTDNYAIKSVRLTAVGKSHHFHQITLLSDYTNRGIMLTASDVTLYIDKLNGNYQGRTGIHVAADRCKVIVNEIYNFNSVVKSAPDVSGVEIYAGSGSNVYIKAHDFVNSGGQGSTPRVLTIQGSSSNTTGEVYAKNVHGLVTSTTSAHLNTVQGENCRDNGLYHLNGNLKVDKLVYIGSEEVIVSELGNLYVGKVIVRGIATTVLGLQDVGSVSIDSIFIEPLMGASVRNIIGTRIGNHASGKIYIGSIAGTMIGSRLIYMAQGTVEYLQIDSMDVTYNYDSAISAGLGFWWNMSACRGFSIKDAKVKIVDINGAIVRGPNIFRITAPGNKLEYKSFWQNVGIRITSSDAVTPNLYASTRGVGFANSLIYHTNSLFQDISGNIYLIGSYDNTLAISGNAAPTGGSWRAGTELLLIGKSKTPLKAKCIAGGTPGTWVLY